MPGYMKITRDNQLTIRGDVTAKGHEGWIAINSAQLGLARQPRTGGGEIVITKFQDGASAELFMESLHGGPLTVEIELTGMAARSEPEAVICLSLEGVLISSFTNARAPGVGQDRPLESLSLSYTRMTQRALAPAGAP